MKRATPPCTFVYKAGPVRGAELAPQLDFRIWPEVGDPAQARFLAAWQPPDARARNAQLPPDRRPATCKLPLRRRP